MRIIVTGAGGFVGRELITMLRDHEVVGIDHAAGGIPNLPYVTAIAGDLGDARVLEKAFGKGCDAVMHLATVPGGAAEQDPNNARRVNIDATMALAEAAEKAGDCPRFVFASSIAVFGESLPDYVDDATPLAPRMVYGAHKAMMEQWLATLTRRGELDAISLRPSGVVARPRERSGMKSAFMSNVFHALRAGDDFVMPVSADATSWMTSLACAAGNFVHALQADLAAAPASRAMTLPALRVRIGDLVAEIARQTGRSPHIVAYEPDAALETGFGAYPPLATAAADQLGFGKDDALAELVSRGLAAIRAEN